MMTTPTPRDIELAKEIFTAPNVSIDAIANLVAAHVREAIKDHDKIWMSIIEEELVHNFTIAEELGVADRVRNGEAIYDATIDEIRKLKAARTQGAPDAKPE